MSRLLVVALLAAFACMQASAQLNWTYDRTSLSGPQNWPQSFPTCATSGQSPIDSSQAQFDSSLTDIVFNYPVAPIVTATNNGQLYELQFPTGTTQFISGGPLAGRYRLRNIQFHVPAEHTFFGTRASAEMQLYHQSVVDPTLWAAVSIFYIEFTENTFLKQFSNKLVLLSFANPNLNSTTLNNLDLAGVVPTSNIYYTYPGTATTPPCRNNVTWFLFDAEQYISGVQLQQLANLGQMQNRPTSPLGGRNVRTNSRDAFLLNVPINNPSSTSTTTTNTTPATSTVPDIILNFSLAGLLSNV